MEFIKLCYRDTMSRTGNRRKNVFHCILFISDPELNSKLSTENLSMHYLPQKEIVCKYERSDVHEEVSLNSGIA